MGISRLECSAWTYYSRVLHSSLTCYKRGNFTRHKHNFSSVQAGKQHVNNFHTCIKTPTLIYARWCVHGQGIQRIRLPVGSRAGHTAHQIARWFTGRAYSASDCPLVHGQGIQRIRLPVGSRAGHTAHQIARWFTGRAYSASDCPLVHGQGIQRIRLPVGSRAGHTAHQIARWSTYRVNAARSAHQIARWSRALTG